MWGGWGELCAHLGDLLQKDPSLDSAVLIGHRWHGQSVQRTAWAAHSCELGYRDGTATWQYMRCPNNEARTRTARLAIPPRPEPFTCIATTEEG